MAAAVLGDAGPRHDGRLSIDPLRHVDLLGGAVALVFSIGWANGWRSIRARCVTGASLWCWSSWPALPRSCWAFWCCGSRGPFLLPLLPDTAAATAFVLIQTIIEVGLWFALLGLLPLPPLMGGHLLVAAVPKLRERLSGVQLFLGLIVAALVATGVVNRLLDPAFRALVGLGAGRRCERVARMEPTGRREAPPDDELRAIRERRSRISLRCMRATDSRLPHTSPKSRPRCRRACAVRARRPPRA